MCNRGSYSTALTTLTGLASFASGAYASTANPGGIAGTSSGFFVYLLVKYKSLTGGNTMMCHRTNEGTFNQGWILQNPTNTTMSFRCVNGSGSLVSSPAWTLTSNEIDKVTGIVGVHDGSRVRAYVNNAEVGSGTAITGYTAHAGLTRIGYAGALAPTTHTLYAFGGGAGVPSLSNIQGWFAAVKSNIAAAMPGVAAEHHWALDNTGTIPDEIGSDNATTTGALTSDAGAITWAW